MNKQKIKNSIYLSFTTLVWLKTLFVISLLFGYFFIPPSSDIFNLNSLLYLALLILAFFLFSSIITFPIWVITRGFVEIIRPLKMHLVRRKLLIYGVCLVQILIFRIILHSIEVDISGKELVKIFRLALIAPAVFILQTTYKEPAKIDEVTIPLNEDLLDDIDFE